MQMGKLRLGGGGGLQRTTSGHTALKEGAGLQDAESSPKLPKKALSTKEAPRRVSRPSWASPISLFGSASLSEETRVQAWSSGICCSQLSRARGGLWEAGCTHQERP